MTPVFTPALGNGQRCFLLRFRKPKSAHLSGIFPDARPTRNGVDLILVNVQGELIQTTRKVKWYRKVHAAYSYTTIDVWGMFHSKFQVFSTIGIKNSPMKFSGHFGKLPFIQRHFSQRGEQKLRRVSLEISGGCGHRRCGLGIVAARQSTWLLGWCRRFLYSIPIIPIMTIMTIMTIMILSTNSLFENILKLFVVQIQ